MRFKNHALALGIGMALGGTAFAQTAPSPAAARALQALETNPALANMATGDTATVNQTVTGPNGTQHVRFQRTYRGLPVIGGDFVVHIARTGKQSSTLASTRTARPESIQPRIDSSRAKAIAGGTLAAGVATSSSARLVVFAYQVPAPVLAYEVRLIAASAKGEPSDMMHYIDAQSGALLTSWSNLQTQRRPLPPPPAGAALGVGNTQYLGVVPLTTTRVGGQTGYRLSDPARGNGQILDARNRGLYENLSTWAVAMTDPDNVWGNGLPSHRQTAAADAYYGIAATWDYFKAVHGRNGIFNDGRGVTSYVHVGFNWANAAWDGRSMYFGDGNGRTFHTMTALDIAGHEMSHGVVTATANLIYSGESGGLNEASADIFGTMVERHSAQALGRSYNWTIGEDSAGPELPMGNALRYMFKPGLDRYVAADGTVMQSAECYSAAVPSLIVHHSSGIGNRFFYLLSEGATVPAGWNLVPADLVCNGNTALAGIGAGDAEKIWYLALTAYFTSSTNYQAARVATLRAASDLFGEGSTQQQAVAASWDAVNVL